MQEEEPHRAGYVVRGAEGDALAVARGRLRDRTLLSGGLPAVGDWVAVRPQRGGRTVMEAVLGRRTKITRKMAARGADEQVIAANVDTVFVVSDVVGDVEPRLLERYVAAVYESGAQPVVVLTKLDLRDGTKPCPRRRPWRWASQSSP